MKITGYKYYHDENLTMRIVFAKEIMQELISDNKKVARQAETSLKIVLTNTINNEDYVELAKENVKMKFEMDLANNHED